MLCTNVTPIIQTHNILSSHNRTHKHPLKPIKNALLLWVRLPASNIWKIIMGTCWMIFLRLEASFFVGLLITFYIQWERKRLFGATPSWKTKMSFFFLKKWTLRGLWKDLAMTSMVDEVTARTLWNMNFVERSLHGRLWCHQKTSLRGPREVHFYHF